MKFKGLFLGMCMLLTTCKVSAEEDVNTGHMKCVVSSGAVVFDDDVYTTSILAADRPIIGFGVKETNDVVTIYTLDGNIICTLTVSYKTALWILEQQQRLPRQQPKKDAKIDN